MLPGVNLSLGDIYAGLLGLGKGFREKILAVANLRGNERVLDVGCGRGRLLEALYKNFPKIYLVGTDTDEKSIRLAQKRLASNIKLRVESAEVISDQSGSFDFVVSSLAFHHMPYEVKRRALKEIYRVLRQGGRFLMVDFGESNKLSERLIAKIICPRAEAAKDNLDGRVLKLLQDTGFKSVKSLGKSLKIVHFIQSEKT